MVGVVVMSDVGKFKSVVRYSVYGGVILYREGFKIRNRFDVEYFIEKVVQPGTTITLVMDNRVELDISKSRDDVFSIGYRVGDIMNPFNPVIEIARSGDGTYKKSVKYYIWNLRKYLNNTLFGGI